MFQSRQQNSEKGDAPSGSIAHVRKKVAIPTRRDGEL
jgi:hypothetical protein